ncbi:hypothetical protein [Yoonia sp.]|uniref:hypothetical protein n=1 Tax=Yoonia sp. TaxID=2212373 RepID=UPI0035C78D3C
MMHFLGGVRTSTEPLPAFKDVWVDHPSCGLTAGTRTDQAKSGSLHAVVAGEVQNAAFLRADLGASPGDAAVVLAAYQKWGVACAAHFDGHFAITLYDAATEQMTLLRDKLGTWPLYITRSDLGKGSPCLFSTDLHALLDLLPNTSPDRDAIAAYLEGNGVPSLFAEITQVPAGHSAQVTPSGGVQILSYTEVDVTAVPSGEAGDISQAEPLRMLDNNTRLHVQRAKQLGVLLQGDVASAGLTGIVNLYHQAAVRTVTPQIDPLVHRAAHRFGTLHSSSDQPADLLALWTQVIWQTGQPVIDSAALTLTHMARYVASDISHFVVPTGASIWAGQSVTAQAAVFSAAQQMAAPHGVLLAAPFLSAGLVALAQTSADDVMLRRALRPLLGQAWEGAALEHAPQDLSAVAAAVMADGRLAARGLTGAVTPQNQVACAALEIWWRLFVENDSEALDRVKGEANA